MKPRADAVRVTTEGQLRTETLHTAILAAVPALLLGVAIMAAVHIGLSTYAERKHDEAQALLQAEAKRELASCRADVARYSDIAALERDAVAAMDRRGR